MESKILTAVFWNCCVKTDLPIWKKKIEETSEFARRTMEVVSKAERLSKPKEVKGDKDSTKEHQVGPFHYSPVQNYLIRLSKDSLVIQTVGSRSRSPLTLLFMRMYL